MTAMIIVTLVATMAAAMVWQQWRAVQVEAAERERTQATWMLAGALDFGRLILREDQKSGGFTGLTQPWATPLAESRVSTFLSLNSTSTDGTSEAFLSGSITDAQSRFNVLNLVDNGIGSNATPGTIIPSQLAVMERLCANIGLDAGVAQTLANALRLAKLRTLSSVSPLMPQSVSQLTWLGLDLDTVEALRPYVEVLDTGAVPVNINTAPKEVLAAVLDVDTATAQKIASTVAINPYKSLGAFTTTLAKQPAGMLVDIQSAYFEVTGRLRLSDRILEERTLLKRGANGNSDPVALFQERISSVDTGHS